METTEWYPRDVWPVHIGFYERLYGNESGTIILRCFWSGDKWMNPFIKGDVSNAQLIPWRGLRTYC